MRLEGGLAVGCISSGCGRGFGVLGLVFGVLRSRWYEGRWAGARGSMLEVSGGFVYCGRDRGERG